jgi:hypothetical protein
MHHTAARGERVTVEVCDRVVVPAEEEGAVVVVAVEVAVVEVAGAGALSRRRAARRSRAAFVDWSACLRDL